MASKRGTPHLLMGDFNAIAPGDHFKASALLRYLIIMDKQYRRNPHEDFEHPNLDSVVPKPLRFLYPLLQTITRSKALCALLDKSGSLYARRGSINMLRKAGYIDCFRLKNPNDPGFTCPAASLAGRIDYIFASPELAERLSACYVVTKGNGLRGDEASDHLPVVAEFGERVEVVKGPALGLTTLTITCWSPRALLCTTGTPIPLRRNERLLCVPAGILSNVVFPSTIGISTSSPSAACAKLIGIS